MIKIITVYNSLNPGSYLQALALYNVIQKEYGEVSFLCTKTRNPIKESLKQSIKLIIKMEFKYAFKQFVMGVKYQKLINKFNISYKKDDNDIFILGSDEIWNIARNEMIKYPIFWGEGLNKKKCISYAPSINYATKEQLESCEYVRKNLEEIYSISVRDTYSKEILQQINNRNIIEVCDPTLLLDRDYYKKIESKKSFKNYIFVYASPSKLTKEEINDIIKFAKKTNKKLISYNIYHQWCDEVVYGEPSVFLSLIHNADYVFTSTFHGTIFSLIYNKQFVVFGKNKKVEEIIKKVKLNNFYKDNNIDGIIKQKIDYTNINSLLDKERDIGLYYLNSNINKLK